jgi:hypothetical protein
MVAEFVRIQFLSHLLKSHDFSYVPESPAGGI